MRRHAIAPRPDRQARFDALGFGFAEIDGQPYWDETACYEFTAAGIDVLDDATVELDRLCLAAVDHAVRLGAHAALGIPEAVWPIVVRSWEAQEPSLYGRMDLRWDGSGAPKLLEYNADTPTALFEAAVVQWDWLQSGQPPTGLADPDQFNSLHEALISAWLARPLPGGIHFTCQRGTDEDRGTVDYLRDTAMQAGLDAPFLHVDEIGWNGRHFVDLAERPIAHCFKLYPWEFLLRDAFGAHVTQATTRWIEPAWRMVLSGKGLLALLWQLFPDHPNLLPAFLEPGRTGGPEIRKPLWGREGANVTAPGYATPGTYGEEGFVHQAWAELPGFSGRYPVLGSWVVGGRAVGLGIREDATPITRDTSRFVPHYFAPG